MIVFEDGEMEIVSSRPPDDTSGPFIVWVDTGDGWRPRSYRDLQTAVLDRRADREWVVTHKIEFEVKAVTNRQSYMRKYMRRRRTKEKT